MAEVASHGKPLLSAEREQLRLELQQLNHQISQQTQLRGLEVQAYRHFCVGSLDVKDHCAALVALNSWSSCVGRP